MYKKITLSLHPVFIDDSIPLVNLYFFLLRAFSVTSIVVLPGPRIKTAVHEYYLMFQSIGTMADRQPCVFRDLPETRFLFV